MTRSPAIDTGMLFLRILVSLLFVVSLSWSLTASCAACGMIGALYRLPPSPT